SSSILEIASHAKELNIKCSEEPGLSDSTTFITQLESMDIVRVSLVCLYFSSSFFDLPYSFWRNFLNEKLGNGSFDCVEITGDDMDEKFTKPPIDTPDDTSFFFLKWTK
ncbi:hypothetical protein PMAYCL1PPCAC_27444, partial [Pristionchus mayeri]